MAEQEETRLAAEDTAPATVSPVRFEHLDSPMGIGAASPRLSWQVVTDDPAWSQTAYELELDGLRVRVASSDQVLVPWPFPPLKSRQRARLRVRVASGDRWSPWSAASTVEAGLLSVADWTARFISPANNADSPAPIVTRAMKLRSGIVSARLYATAHGVYQATLNGTKVGDDVLAPGWTSYQHRLRYQTYDVTGLLHEGENELSALLGNGWYSGRIRWRAAYGGRLAFLAQLEVIYDDGTAEFIATDEQWSAVDSGVVTNDLYEGQSTDLRPRQPKVSNVEVIDAALRRLVAPEGPPMRVTDVLPAQTLWQSPSGRTLADFGQNLVGWVRLRVHGARSGDRVVIRHAEVLENGELCVRPLRGAKATDTYVLPDTEELQLEPTLTFHGFRYAEIEGVPEVELADLEAVVISSDLRTTGWFSCSDPDLNQFHRNVTWGARGNFLDVPTDCPQRDERLGWTGDIQVFAPTATFLYDTAGFLSSWLADLAADQHPDGAVPFVIPDVVPVEAPAAAAWGDAATIVPWVLYQRYGDVQILERQIDSMRAWVDKVASLTTDGVWAGGFQWGDWLDPTAPPDDPAAAKADPDVIATAHLVRSAEIVAQASAVLGHRADAERYARLATETRNAFAREYVTQTGRILSDAPTVYALAIEWGLLPTAAQREGAGQRLADLVRTNGFRIATGFVGTPVITDALCTSGYPDLAYRLLLERSCPSWLYPVTMGATTIWERWDSMLPDGSINPGEMTSFNHYALGAVADWIHRTVAGLAPAAPGYREITVKPIPHRLLTHASAKHQTPYGEAAVSWARRNGEFVLQVTVPPGTHGTVHLPGAEPVSVTHGHHVWTIDDPCRTQPREISTIRDLIDTPTKWSAAATALISHGFGDNPADIAALCAPYLRMSPTDLPSLLARQRLLFEGDGEEVRLPLE